MTHQISIIGAGLAGCQAALTCIENNIPIQLIDMKPSQKPPAHTMDSFAELVCSNSLRSDQPRNAVGLLKSELEHSNSFIMQAARKTAVPAGRALAVNRKDFSHIITEQLRQSPLCTIIEACIEDLPADQNIPCIIATGPLTAPTLLTRLQKTCGLENLSFFDALAPIVDGDSIDRDVIYPGSRYNPDEHDYLNCPMNKQEFETFYTALMEAPKLAFNQLEPEHFFEGCMPIEELGRRNPQALTYGPLKPVGLDDPKTGRWPYAVVQLRREDKHGQAWNLVGFQTRLKQSAQPEVFRLIPGLEKASFLRLGAMHKNAYINAPQLLQSNLSLKEAPWIYIAGQLSGVEGYVESIAHGFLVSLFTIAAIRGIHLPPPPPTTALGALYAHNRGDWLHITKKGHYEPHNVHWGLFPPLDESLGKIGKKDRALKRYERGINDFKQWWHTVHHTIQA